MNTIDSNSALVQVMAWGRWVPSYYLSQWRPSLLTFVCVFGPQSVHLDIVNFYEILKYEQIKRCLKVISTRILSYISKGSIEVLYMLMAVAASSELNAYAHRIGGLLSIRFFTWSSTAQSVCEQAFNLLASWWLRRPALNPGMVVTKAPFVNFSVSKIFDLAKVPVTFFESHWYLTGVTAAELRQHLSNMNEIFNS